MAASGPLLLRLDPTAAQSRSWNVRWIGWLLLMLVVLGWLAGEVPLAGVPPQGPQEPQDDWRRTASGWEHRSTWTLQTPSAPPAIHPAVFGLLQLSLAWAALIAVSGNPAGSRFRRSAKLSPPPGRRL